MNDVLEKLRRWEIPDHVSVALDQGGLPLLHIRTPWSTAEIHTQGAQVTGFKKTGEPPLLFVSAKSAFAPGKAIRGGVPICFPWFGSRTGEPAHGFARITDWHLVETTAKPAGIVTIRLQLPTESLNPAWSGLCAQFTVTAGETLTMELEAANDSPDKNLEIENCLHSYFHVGDISQVTITGLRGAYYLDTAADGHGERKLDNDPALKLVKETNRLYENTTAALEIRDENFQRAIRVEKENSHSSVVWNPWTTQLMSDFDPAEHKNMVCVEAGNIKQNKITLAPDASSLLRVTLSSAPLK